MPALELTTERLRLRRWRASDRPLFAALNADPVVMEHFPAPLTVAESDTFVDRIDEHFDRVGFGLWAVERIDRREFIGYVGLWPATFDARFTPAIEIGWRLAREHWGLQFAPEAARRALRDGFERLELDEIVSFTARTNENSQRVMQKLGMTTNPDDDFDHPGVDVASPLREHVLYRLTRRHWLRQQ